MSRNGKSKVGGKGNENELRAAVERYQLVLRGFVDGFWDWESVTDQVSLNRRFKELLGYQEDEMESSFEAWVEHVHPEDRDQMFMAMQAHLETHCPYDVRLRLHRKDESWGWFRTRGQAVWDRNGTPVRMAGTITDISAQRANERRLEKTNCLLVSLHEVQGAFISSSNMQEIFDRLLEILLELSQSEYGFIGEVLYKEDGDPYLKTYAITNIAWNQETRDFYERYAPDGLEFFNLKTLFGTVMTSGRPVIANHPSLDPRGGGIPPGHPPLNAFLGLPFHHGEELTGMIGIANRPGGYDDELAAYLEPLTTTCGHLISAHRSDLRRREAERELQEAHDALEARVIQRTAELKEANDELSQFTSIVSHDLKAPLITIRSYTQLLKKDLDELIDERSKGYLDTLDRTAQDAEALIHDLLDLARIERGKLRFSRVDVEALVRGIAQQHAAAPDTEVRIESPLPELYSEPTLLSQLLTNLVTNGLKFNTSSHRWVRVSWRAEDGGGVLTVADNGIGIDQEFHERIFEPFQRLHSSSEYEGTGVGLAIVKKTITALGGEVRLESEIGRGTTFHITLPEHDEDLKDANPDERRSPE